LVRTARQFPLLVAVGPQAAEADRRRLREAGSEVFVCQAAGAHERLEELLDELGRRRMTNVLVEGGAGLLGSLLDAGQIDEVHVFIAPKLIGGRGAASPFGGEGLENIEAAWRFEHGQWRAVGDDMYFTGRTSRNRGAVAGGAASGH
jgi:diaminohydroxyphosphoribosylaminopyrimidine deaminase/5-amino-6-(5-phosphoribosylamino)uracil reductase